MPKNHAKAIKGMSIACIAIAGIIILVCLAGLAMIAFFGPILEEVILDSYTYDYGYGYDYDSIFGAYGLTAALEPIHGHHAYYSSDFPSAYDDLGELQVMLSMFNVLLVLGIIAEGIVLAAAIIVLKNSNNPEKFGMVFVWSIVGAVIGFFASGIIQGVLFIIIAVFVNSDKKLYQSGMYFVPTPGAPGAVAYAVQQPVPPMAPVAPGVPGVPVAQAPMQPIQPVQPVQPVQPAAVEQPIQPVQSAAAATAQAIEQPGAQVTTAEIYQRATQVQPALAPGETQPPAPAEAQVAASDAAIVGEATVVEEASVIAVEPDAIPAEATSAPVETAPVIVDEGAVIKLDVNGDQPSEQ